MKHSEHLIERVMNGVSPSVALNEAKEFVKGDKVIITKTGVKGTVTKVTDKSIQVFTPSTGKSPVFYSNELELSEAKSKLDSDDIASAVQSGDDTTKKLYAVDKSTPKSEVDAAIKDALKQGMIKQSGDKFTFVKMSAGFKPFNWKAALGNLR